MAPGRLGGNPLRRRSGTASAAWGLAGSVPPAGRSRKGVGPACPEGGGRGERPGAGRAGPSSGRGKRRAGGPCLSGPPVGRTAQRAESCAIPAGGGAGCQDHRRAAKAPGRRSARRSDLSGGAERPRRPPGPASAERRRGRPPPLKATGRTDGAEGGDLRDPDRSAVPSRSEYRRKGARPRGAKGPSARPVRLFDSHSEPDPKVRGAGSRRSFAGRHRRELAPRPGFSKAPEPPGNTKSPREKRAWTFGSVSGSQALRLSGSQALRLSGSQAWGRGASLRPRDSAGGRASAQGPGPRPARARRGGITRLRAAAGSSAAGGVS